jgi:hypothetical protein
VASQSITLTERPAAHAPAPATAALGLTCPLASNCSCVFARFQAEPTERASAPAPDMPAALAASVATWREWGWSLVSSTGRDAVMERQRLMSFCAHLALTVATAGLWLIYWLPRVRRPRIETVTLTLGSGGAVRSSAKLH